MVYIATFYQNNSSTLTADYIPGTLVVLPVVSVWVPVGRGCC